MSSSAEIIERERRREAARTRHVVYAVPDMDRVEVIKDVPYAMGDPGPLHLDVYSPVAPLDVRAGARPPAVVFVSGGGALKDWGAFTSYGRLAAASGVAAVTFDTHPAGTWEEEHLLAGRRRCPHRVPACAWRRAGHRRRPAGAVGLLRRDTVRSAHGDEQDAPYVRCLVVFYGALDTSTFGGDTQVDVSEYSPLRYLRAHSNAIPPMFIARAGKDRPALNASIDRYVAAALELNADLQLHNHAEGQHGFSVLDDSPRSREIIRAALDFVRTHLGASEDC